MIFATLIMFDFAFSYKGNKKKLALATENVQKVTLNEEVPKENKEVIEQKEVKEIVQKVEELQDDPNFNPDYTVRLDLDELMKQIDNHMNGDDDV